MYGRKRVFLFLQGHPSTFACKVAEELERMGHTALRINFCFGDQLLWRKRPSVNYRKPFSRWEAFLDAFLEQHGVTDIVYYGDRKPYHQVAAKLARQRGIKCFAYEFGYLRPDWITLERGGMSAFSHFPNDPDLIRSIARTCEPMDSVERYPYTKPREIVYEVSYNLLSYFTPFLFPFYKADRYYNPLIEYISGIPGLFVEQRRHGIARRLTMRLARQRHPFFIFSLQLQSDYQLRSNANFAHQKEAMALVLDSFAKHADKKACLVFKAHPLDNGWEGWGRFLTKKIKQLGLEGRAFFVVGGNLTHMLKWSKGCIMINSTVGLHALRAGCPVKVLGHALYDMPGLTHQGSIERFWTEPDQPDKALTEDLVKVIAATIQVKGNFFTTKGQRAGVASFAQMLDQNMVNGKGAFVDPPPRLTNLQANEPPMFAYEVASHGEAASIGPDAHLSRQKQA